MLLVNGNPVGVSSGGGAPHLDGTYGMAVWATAFPSTVEFWEAVETAVGSGTYGSFAVVGAPVPSVQGDWTVYRRIAPNDGLRRQIKARHVKDGATASAFTAAVTVSPWTTPQRVPLSPATRTVPYADDGNYAATSDSSGQVYLLGAGTSSTQKVNVGTPSTPASMQRKYRLNFIGFTSQNATNANSFDKTQGDLRPSAAATGINFVGVFVLPQGATIVSVTMRGYKQNAGDTCVGQLWKLTDSSNTILATLTLSATAAWTPVSNSSLSEVVGATYAYAFSINLVGVASPNDARFEYVELVATVPDLNTGL